MKPWLLFGAGGTGVGAHLLTLALQAGRPVVALVRNVNAAERLTALGIRVVTGDACDDDAVTRACELAGKDATIISTIGGSEDYLAHRTLIDAAERAGLSRMIMVTSLGCGDTWQYQSERARVAFGHAVREKTLAEAWLQTSQLDYAIVRPGGLLNGEVSGQAQCFQHQEVHGFVNRKDVAQTIARLDADAVLNNQVYSLVEPGLKPGG